MLDVREEDTEISNMYFLFTYAKLPVALVGTVEVHYNESSQCSEKNIVIMHTYYVQLHI